MSTTSKEAVLATAKRTAMAHGYNGLNIRDIAAEVGIKAPSIYDHFPTKADLGVPVARRNWEDTVDQLEAISDEAADPLAALHRYPEIFRISLSTDNRICLSSFMAAEYDDLPDPVKTEVQGFTDVNVAWLSKLLVAAKVVPGKQSETRARDLRGRRRRTALCKRSLRYRALRSNDRQLPFDGALAGLSGTTAMPLARSARYLVRSARRSLALTLSTEKISHSLRLLRTAAMPHLTTLGGREAGDRMGEEPT